MISNWKFGREPRKSSGLLDHRSHGTKGIRKETNHLVKRGNASSHQGEGGGGKAENFVGCGQKQASRGKRKTAALGARGIGGLQNPRGKGKSKATAVAVPNLGKAAFKDSRRTQPAKISYIGESTEKRGSDARRARAQGVPP